MSGTLQRFLTTAIPKAATDLETALLRLPEDKRGWSAEGKARTALDIVAECAILNGATAELIVKRHFDVNFSSAHLQRAKDDLGQDWQVLKATLHENTARAVAEIKKVHDEDLSVLIDMPWGQMTLAQVCAYPYWNMSYHEGQLNFIASMLGCLD